MAQIVARADILALFVQVTNNRYPSVGCCQHQCRVSGCTQVAAGLMQVNDDRQLSVCGGQTQCLLPVAEYSGFVKAFDCCDVAHHNCGGHVPVAHPDRYRRFTGIRNKFTVFPQIADDTFTTGSGCAAQGLETRNAQIDTVAMQIPYDFKVPLFGGQQKGFVVAGIDRGAVVVQVANDRKASFRCCAPEKRIGVFTQIETVLMQVFDDRQMPASGDDRHIVIVEDCQRNPVVVQVAQNFKAAAGRRKPQGVGADSAQINAALMQPAHGIKLASPYRAQEGMRRREHATDGGQCYRTLLVI